MSKIVDNKEVVDEVKTSSRKGRKLRRVDGVLPDVKGDVLEKVIKERKKLGMEDKVTLYELRKQLGIKRLDACKAIDVAPPTLDRIETGQRVMKLQDLANLLELYGKYASDIFFHDEHGNYIEVPFK